MKKLSIWMIGAPALLTVSTVYADETTASAETVAAAETARVSAINGNWIIMALIFGFLIALMVTAVWKAQLRSVHAKWEAYDYVRRDSLNLSSNNERFLYRNIQKVPIPKEQKPGGQGGHGGTITFGGSAGGMGGSGGGIMFGGPGGSGGGTHFGGPSGAQGGHNGFTLGGGSGGQGGHTGFTLGGLGGHGSSGSSQGGSSGLNYGGHLDPGAKPGSGRPGAEGRPGGMFNRGPKEPD